MSDPTNIKVLITLIHSATRENANKLSFKHSSLLHYACYNNYVDGIKYLETLGADLNLFDYQYMTPISWAVREGSKDAVIYLISKRVNVNLRDYMSCAPIHVAYANKWYELGYLLLNAGANPDLDPLLPSDMDDFDEIHQEDIDNFNDFIDKCRKFQPNDSMEIV